ncbi:MAG: hypothetical protein Q8O05_03775, partial [Chloroflexota bacterium]|nr:hypothetical protein [Chloroflexota bacterium]
MKGKLWCALFAAMLAMSFSRMPMMSAEATSLNVPEQYPVIQAVVTYTLTLHATPSTAGSIAASPSGSTYDSGTNVTLTASANRGYHFVHWEGDLSGSTNPTTIVMNGNKDVTAIFAQDQYTLAVSTNGQGTVTRTPDQPTYTYGTPVTLTTSAPVGWSFERWSGDLIGSTNPTTIPIHSNMAITANFIQDQYKLTIKTNGPGYVTKNPDQTTYTYGIVVTLSASPALGFESWSGDLSGSANPATIVMNGNKTVTATFNEARYTLAVSTTGQGSVARTPDQPTYPIGTVVTLTASPATGWSFDRWSGDLSGSANP